MYASILTFLRTLWQMFVKQVGTVQQIAKDYWAKLPVTSKMKRIGKAFLRGKSFKDMSKDLAKEAVGIHLSRLFGDYTEQKFGVRINLG